MPTSQIPIENIYYLLCYAWGQLEEGRIVDVSTLESTSLVDLFARVLTKGVERLAKRGLERVYAIHEDELRGVRGRIDLIQTERRMLRKHGLVACAYDELTADSLPNQIIRGTLRALGRHASMQPKNRDAVTATYRHLREVGDIRITDAVFRRVQLHSNSRHYRFLLNVCELIHRSWLVEETTGAQRFQEFVKDRRQMAYVFQSFVLNFLRIERPDLRARRENIAWKVDTASDVSSALLPIMQTDVSMDCGGQHIILDTKFYEDTLVEYRGGKKFHTEHLYQLFSYLVNYPAGSTECAGILLYPAVDDYIDENFVISGHPIRVRTLDLTRPWQQIHADLAGMIPRSCVG